MSFRDERHSPHCWSEPEKITCGTRVVKIDDTMRVCCTTPNLIVGLQWCVITDTRKKPFLIKINVAEGWGCLSSPSWASAIWNRSYASVMAWAEPKLVSGDQWGHKVILVKRWNKFHEAKKSWSQAAHLSENQILILVHKTGKKFPAIRSWS